MKKTRRSVPGFSFRRLCHRFQHALLAGWLLLGVVFGSVATQPSLELFTEDYPPLTFERDGEIVGGGTAIVREIMRRAGVTVSMQLVPWSRGYAATLRRENTALFVTALTPEREPLFKWVGPIASTRGQLYALKARNLKIESLAEAGRARQVAVPRDWYLHEMLVKAGLDPERFMPVYLVSESPKYIAFSRLTDDAIVNACRQALADMIADGSLAKIYRESLPGMVPPVRVGR